MAGGKTAYLILYNAVSAVLWLTVLGRVVGTLYLRSWDFVPLTVDNFLRNTQTLAGLEILHSVLGVVRTPFLSTFLQIGSRFLVVWGATFFFPEVAQTPWYTSMVLAWSVTEVVRYTYFALALSGWEPYALLWQRYSGFFWLYPIGISGELVLLYRAITGPAGPVMGEWYKWALIIATAVYIPGSPFLYMHMVKQRSKVLKKKRAERNGQANGNGQKKDL